MNFKPRPDEGVSRKSSEGIYYHENILGQVQLINIGPMAFRPIDAANAYGAMVGMRYRIFEVTVLKPNDYDPQIDLDRGVISFHLERI